MELTRALQDDAHCAVFWRVIPGIRQPDDNIREHAAGPHLGYHPALVIEPIIVRVTIPIRPPARTVRIIVVITQRPSSRINYLQESTLAIIVVGCEPHRLLIWMSFLVFHPNG